MRKLMLVAAASALLGGCGTVTAPGASTTSTTTTTRASRHSPARHRRRHRSRPSHRLPVGRASNRAVQPQPPPGSCHARGSGELSRPDPRCTPGAISPGVRQANIQSTICRSGYSESVRPPESVTEPEKYASMAAYGHGGPAHGYEYDHLVALELGGAANDPRNLWPEPGGSPNTKDGIEDRLHALVCDGAIALSSAQNQIARNWVAAYRRYIGPIP